jgi:hypothetical protein
MELLVTLAIRGELKGLHPLTRSCISFDRTRIASSSCSLCREINEYHWWSNKKIQKWFDSLACLAFQNTFVLFGNLCDLSFLPWFLKTLIVLNTLAQIRKWSAKNKVVARCIRLTFRRFNSAASQVAIFSSRPTPFNAPCLLDSALFAVSAAADPVVLSLRSGCCGASKQGGS